MSEQQKPEDLPADIQKLFDILNEKGLSFPRDPICADMNYTKGRSPWLVECSIRPPEKRVQGTPKEIETAYQNWYLNDWKQRSRISKIFSILWYLPSHFYRKYLASLDYRWYYQGLMSFLGRKQTKM